MSNVAEKSVKIRTRELTIEFTNVNVISDIDENSFSGDVGIQPDQSRFQRKEEMEVEENKNVKRNHTCDFLREKKEMNGSGDGGRCEIKGFYLSAFFFLIMGIITA